VVELTYSDHCRNDYSVDVFRYLGCLFLPSSMVVRRGCVAESGVQATLCKGVEVLELGLKFIHSQSPLLVNANPEIEDRNSCAASM